MPGAVEGPKLGEVVADKRIIICVGSGGVGKTTTAAALALQAALLGRRALVLTIDPAKRLANSLGLPALGHDVQRVPDALIGELLDANGGRGGSLDAMMLDQKRAFDEVVEAYAEHPDSVRRILDNPIYNQMSSSLAGAHEYAAMAKVDEFDRGGDYDVIVVDTPPTTHALDFLDAPEKLSSAIDSPAIEWFRKIRGTGLKERRGLIGRAGDFFLTRLAKFVGSDFLQDMAVFFTEFNEVLGGFRERAEETYALLRRPNAAFVIVASPELMAMREAAYFYQRLHDYKMPFAAFVVNRVRASLPSAHDQDWLTKALQKEPALAGLEFSQQDFEAVAEAFHASHRDLQVLAEADHAAIEELRGIASDREVVKVPLFRHDIYSVDRLADLGRSLLATTQ